MRNTYLSNYYFKLKQRRGAKKAIVALARKILVVIYHLLKNKEVYNEMKFELSKQKQEELRIKKLNTVAKKLGFLLVPAEDFALIEQKTLCADRK
jgi:uncharacterized membrane protein